MIREDVSGLAYGLGWSAVRRMPERLAYTSAERIADNLWARHGKQVRRLESNLAHVFPDAPQGELRVLSRAGMRNYLRYWCDTFRMPDWDHEKIIGGVRPIDDHYLSGALAEGKGVVLALPHIGNWDHAGAWACLVHGRVTTVAERLKPESLYERFLAYRASLGMEVLPHDGAGVSVFDVLRTRLEAGGFVALVADRDLSSSGLEVDFFGSPIRVPIGPARLAIQTGAPLLTASVYYEGAQTVVRIHPRVPIPSEGSLRERLTEVCQTVVGRFEDTVSAHPTDWHMLSRLWLADLDERDNG